MIRRQLTAIGSRRRKLYPGHEALLAMVHLGMSETFAELQPGEDQQSSQFP